MDRSKEQNNFLSTKNTLYILAAVFFVTTSYDIYQYYSTGFFVDKELRDEYDTTLHVWASWSIFSSFLMIALIFMFYAIRSDVLRTLKVGEIMILLGLVLSSGMWTLDEMISPATGWLPGSIFFLGYTALLLLAGGCALMKWGSSSNKTAEG